MEPLLRVENLSKSFPGVQALREVRLHVMPGEVLGVIGENGAGKSTLMKILAGVQRPDGGTLFWRGAEVRFSKPSQAIEAGISLIHQELNLAENLTVAENLFLGRLPTFWGVIQTRQMRQQADALLSRVGLEVSSSASLGKLSIAQRQMVEIAMAFSDAGIAPRVVILDEPTSSLDQGLAAQLLAHVGRFVQAGGAVILISHILGEILSSATRIIVMKDGRIVAEAAASEFTQASLVAAMGSTAKDQTRSTGAATGGDAILKLDLPRGLPFVARKGEVIGLAGLGGHGQTDMLVGLFEQSSPAWWPRRDPAATFVAGDRRLNGTFDLWSILRNMTIASLPDLSRRGMVDRTAEAQRADTWKSRIAIRTPDMNNPILSLSGGNQQKVLFARALSTRAPLVLMDDPMRGVDVGTKQEVYDIIRAEAAVGRTFVWYSTEIDEMALCDRVYVFREGAIVAELTGDGINEHAILSASFKSEAA